MGAQWHRLALGIPQATPEKAHYFGCLAELSSLISLQVEKVMRNGRRDTKRSLKDMLVAP